MKQDIIELKRYRTFDQTIEIAFKFFKKYLKDILVYFWKHNKILITAMFISYFLYNYFATLNFNIKDFVRGMQVEEEVPVYQTLINLLYFVLSFVFYIKLMLTVFGFVKVYVKTPNDVTEEKVTREVSGRFWYYTGASLFLMVMLFILTIGATLAYLLLAVLGNVVGIFLGILFFVIYVIYLITLTNFFYYILFTEKTDIFNAFSLAMSYIKERFWYSIGVMLILLATMIFISLMLNYPMIIYLISKLVLGIETQDYSTGMQGSILLSAYATLSFVGENILRIMLLIGSTAMFYSIRETRTSEGLFEKIEKIGENSKQTSSVQEQVKNQFHQFGKSFAQDIEKTNEQNPKQDQTGYTGDIGEINI